MKFKTKTSPFFNSNQNINGVMLQVLFALIPGSLVMIYFFGWGILFNIILSMLFAVLFEALAVIDSRISTTCGEDFLNVISRHVLYNRVYLWWCVFFCFCFFVSIILLVIAHPPAPQTQPARETGPVPIVAASDPPAHGTYREDCQHRSAAGGACN